MCNPYDDMKEAVLMEMASNHPRLSSAGESSLKAALLDIIADEAGWRHDPREMGRRFQGALNAVLNACPPGH